MAALGSYSAWGFVKEGEGHPQLGEKWPQAPCVCQGRTLVLALVSCLPHQCLGGKCPREQESMPLSRFLTEDLSRCVMQEGPQETSPVENICSAEVWAEGNNTNNYQVLRSHHGPSSAMHT